jgi:fructose-bisphosphate aldolase, class II
MTGSLKNNRAIVMLKAAEEGGYGVPGIVSVRPPTLPAQFSVEHSKTRVAFTDCHLKYNLETIVAVVRAAEAKRSPVQILLFPWAIKYANGLFVNLVADACRSATVPIALHLDHAQDESIIKIAADMPNAFDSIMIDMSHYDKAENLDKTRKWVAYCHERGIATEAEPGRMEGGEDGVKDIGDLQGVLTTPEEAMEFVETGIDFLAPAFGKVHGNYGGVENMKLDFPRCVYCSPLNP